MKKTIKLLSLLFLISMIFISCNKDVEDAKKAAQEFGINLYTVDGEKIAEYNKYLEESQKPEKIGEVMELIQSVDKDIVPLMTEEGYKRNVLNRVSILPIEICINDGYTLQVTDFILGENSYDGEEDKAGYDYEAKLKFISDDEKTEQKDTAKGYIELIKENDQWKVSVHRLQESPKMSK